MTRTDHQRTADRAWAKATGNADALGQWDEYERLHAIDSRLREARTAADLDLSTARVNLAAACSGSDTAKAILAASAKVAQAEAAEVAARRALDAFTRITGPYGLAQDALRDGVERRSAVVAQWGASLAEKVHAQRLLGQEAEVDLPDDVLTYCAVQNEVRLQTLRQRLRDAERIAADRVNLIQSAEDQQYVKAARAEVTRLQSALAAG